MSYEGASRRNKLTVREILSKLAKQSEELLNPSVSVVEDEFKNILVELVEPRPTGEKKDDGQPVTTMSDLRPLQIYDLVSKHPCFHDTKSIQVPGTKLIWKFNYSTDRVAHDRVALNYGNEFLRKTMSLEFESMFRSAVGYMSSNGTNCGLFTRLLDELPKREPVLENDAAPLIYMGEHLPFAFISEDDSVTFKVPETIDVMDETAVRILESADAGMPFMFDGVSKCTPLNVSKAVVMVNKYLDLLKRDTSDDFILLNTYFKSHPEETLFMLKRKHERMKTVNFWKKVRPYYVPPLALKLIFLWVAHHVQTRLVNYVDDFESCSAYRTSMFYGGATRLIEWVKAVTVQAVSEGLAKFKAICYGDDQYWIFAFPSGRFVVLLPDVIAMDMHVPSVCGTYLLELFSQHYFQNFNEYPPKVFRRAFRLLNHLAFHTNVHIIGSYNFLMMWGLRSGIPLTTLYDIVFSAVIQSHVETYFYRFDVKGKPTRLSKCYDVDDEYFQKFISALFGESNDISKSYLYKKCGVKFKWDTLKINVYGESLPYPLEHKDELSTEDRLLLHDFNFSNITVFDTPFLGFIYHKITCQIDMPGSEEFGDVDNILIGWIPVPVDTAKFLASILTANRHHKGDKSIINLMERIYGIYISGGWYNDILSEFLQGLYSKLRKSNESLKPQYVDCLPMTMEDGDEVFNLLIRNSPDLPQKKIIQLMYLMDKETFGMYVRQYGTLPVDKTPKMLESAPIEIEIVQNELPLSFGTLKISKIHAGKLLPKPKQQVVLKPPPKSPIKFNVKKVKLKDKRRTTKHFHPVPSDSGFSSGNDDE